MPNDSENSVNSEVIPNITDFFDNKDEMREFSFVQPSIENGMIEVVFEGSTSEPNTEIMSVRKLKMKPTTAIGFHRHRRKEKIYRLVSNGLASVLLQEKDGIKAHYLAGYTTDLVIPPNRWHAITAIEGIVVIQVTASSKDALDIEWQPKWTELQKNLHQVL